MRGRQTTRVCLQQSYEIARKLTSICTRAQPAYSSPACSECAQVKGERNGESALILFAFIVHVNKRVCSPNSDPFSSLVMFAAFF